MSLTFNTGETPIQFCGIEFGGRDDYKFADWRDSGCIDAPDAVPAGSMRFLQSEEGPIQTWVVR